MGHASVYMMFYVSFIQDFGNHMKVHNFRGKRCAGHLQIGVYSEREWIGGRHYQIST